MNYFAILLVFTVFFIIYLQDPVFACQCVADRTLQDEYDDSDFIFSATVLDTKSGGYKQVSVEAMEQWKGDIPDKISFLSCRGVSSGGVEIKEGKSYLFFAEKTAQKYPVANDCGHTKLLSDAKNEIQFLDQKSNLTRFYYDDSTITPDPQCKSGPRPDGEGWVFVDCKWQRYVDVPVENCNKGSPPANKYAWSTQNCVWEWSPLRNENRSGPIQEFSDEDICGTGNILVDGICINPNVEDFDAGLNQVILFTSIAGIMIGMIVFVIWRKRK